MAKLIDLSTAERPPIRQPREDIARIRDAGPSTAPGEALMNLGATVENSANQFARAQKIEEDRINTLRAEDAYTKLRERQLDLSAGDENGFTRLKGADAVTKNVYQEWTQKFQDAQAEIESGLANDDQRAKFKKRADVAGLQYKEEILRHLAREGDTYAKEVYDGTINTEKRNAVARWDSPNDVAASLERIRNAVDESGDRFGWDKNYRDSKFRVEAGAVHGAVIQQSIASGDYKYAQAWYEAHKEDVDLATSKQLEKAVEDGTQKQLAADYTAQFLANRDSARGLDALSKTVLGDKTLDDTRRNIIVGRIESRIDALNSRNDRERARQERVLQRGIDQTVKLIEAGFEPSTEQLMPLVSAAKGTDLEDQAKNMVALANATLEFRRATPQQQEDYITRLETAIRKDPTRYDVTFLTRIKAIKEGQDKAVQADPTTFAVRQGLVDPDSLAASPLDLTKPEQLGPQLQARYDLGRSLMATRQAPFKPLTKEEADLLVAKLKRANADEKSNLFSRLAQASGSDFDGYSAIMAQIAPDDPVTAIAGQAAGRSYSVDLAGYQPEPGKSRMVSDLMLKGQAALRPNRKEDGSPDKGKLWPMPQGKDEMTMHQLFADYERDAFSGMPKARSDHYQAAVAAYAGLTIEAGDGSGTLNVDRWKEAMKLATGGIERWNGRSIVMPWGMDYGKFKDGLRLRIQGFEVGGNLPDGMTASKLDDMPLESAGDGRYVFRAGDGILVGKDKRPLVIDFNTPLYIPSGARGTEAAPARFPSMFQK